MRVNRVRPEVFENPPKLRYGTGRAGAKWAATKAPNVGYPSEFRPLQLWTIPTVCALVWASTPLITSIIR